MFILYDVKLFISRLFDVKKENNASCNVFLFGGYPGYYFLFDVKKENITCNDDFI